MMKNHIVPVLSILSMLLFALIGCSDDDKTEAKKVDPAVLDWHLQFSTAIESELFRCEQVTSLDKTRVLFDPITVTTQTTLITPQILDQIKAVLQATDSTSAKSIEPSLKNPTFIMVLFSLRFASDRNIYEPFEISPTIYPDELHTLDEIEFQFGNLESPPEEGLQLFWDGVPLTIIDSGLPDTLKADTLYLLVFRLPDGTSSEAFSQRITRLTLTLSMISPFTTDFCDVGNTHTLTFDLPVVSGTPEAIMKNYGPLTTRLTTEQVEGLRWSVLTSVVDQLKSATL